MPVLIPVIPTYSRYNVDMKKLATLNVEQPASQPPRSAGWFMPGDRRINLLGRPRGRKADVGETRPAAQRADRVRLLTIPAQDLAWCLSRQMSPWITNLPLDAEIVGYHFDDMSNSVTLVIRSRSFEWLARGTLIPPLRAEYNGLKYRRRHG